MNIQKEMPDATCDFLRFQIGRIEKREIGHGVFAPVFHLLGFGSTLEKAKWRADRAQNEKVVILP